MSDAVFDYMTGQMRPSQKALLEAFAAESEAAVAAHAPDLDVRYGPHPRAVFDFFRAQGDAIGTLLYFHAGYWQSRDKAPFRFLAPPLLAAGFHVALANYPLCPEVDLEQLTEAARAAVPAVMRHAGAVPLIAGGHSAGGHLAIEILLGPDATLAAWPSQLAGALAISGVYDLVPLLQTPLNDRLRLDLPTARQHSPLHRVLAGRRPALFMAGGAETAAFLDQTARMQTAWAGKGNQATGMVIEGADHFSVLREIATPHVIAALRGMVA